MLLFLILSLHIVYHYLDQQFFSLRIPRNIQFLIFYIIIDSGIRTISQKKRWMDNICYR